MLTTILLVLVEYNIYITGTQLQGASGKAPSHAEKAGLAIRSLLEIISVGVGRFGFTPQGADSPYAANDVYRLLLVDEPVITRKLEGQNPPTNPTEIGTLSSLSPANHLCPCAVPFKPDLFDCYNASFENVDGIIITSLFTEALDHDLETSSGHLSEVNRVQKTAKKNDDKSAKYDNSLRLHRVNKEHRKHKTVDEENNRKKQKHKEKSKSKEKTADERRREELERAGVLPPSGKTSKYRDGSSKQGTNNDDGWPRPTAHSPKANDIREWLASGSKPDKSKTDNVWYKSDSLPSKDKVGDRWADSGSHWVKDSDDKSSYQLSTQLPKGVTWTKTKTNNENKLSKETIRNRLLKPPKNEVTARMKGESNTTSKEENQNFTPSTTPTKMKGKHRLKHKLKHILASSQKYKANRPPPQYKTTSLDSAISYLSDTKPVVDYEDARRHGKLIYSKGLSGNGNRPKMSASVDEGNRHGTIVFSKDGTRNDNWPETVNNRDIAIGRPAERWQQSLKTLKNKNWGRAPSPVKSDSTKGLGTPTVTTFSEKVARKYPKNPVVTKNTSTWPRVADDAGQYVTYDRWPEFSLESLKHGNLLEHHHKPWPVSPENQNSDPDTNRVTNFWPNLAMDLSPSYSNDHATESKGWPNLYMGDGRSNHIDPAGDTKSWAKSLSMEDTRGVPSNPWPQETREKPMSVLDSAIARHSSATAGTKDTNTTNRQWPHFTYHRVTSSPQMLAAAQRARHRNAYIAVSVVPPQGASKNKSQVIGTGGGPSEIKVNSTGGVQPQRAPLLDKMDELLAARRDPLEEELIDVAAGVKGDSSFQEIPWSHARHLDKIQGALRTLSQDSNPDFLVTSISDYCQSDVLDHATTYVEVKEGFGNQINLCRDRGLKSGPLAQKFDTLPLDRQEQLKSLSAMEEKLRYHWLEKERLHQILRDGGKSRSGFYRSVRDSSTPHPFTTITTTTTLQ
ncbi:unnamed protein product [Timema podura]|uniref:Uncharacterized protein n=1 Tax=Timema podura TaxID=61482 RepID=A0ABN7NJN1_TIMPD|nr:unnamed protein product [Timema podura]